jgi:hypothetical protein
MEDVENLEEESVTVVQAAPQIHAFRHRRRELTASMTPPKLRDLRHMFAVHCLGLSIRKINNLLEQK